MHEVFLKKQKVKENKYPYIIAEIGVNHEGSLEKAFELVDLAASAGAHAAKFQTYKADTIASVKSPAYWDLKKEDTKTQHELFKKYDNFGEKEYILLHQHCLKKNIEFLSTPFDVDCLAFLDPLLNYYKIASADINNLPLLKEVAKKNKPVILSTGASTIDEIKFSLKYLKDNGCPDVSLLHCILNYPTNYENANLLMIKDLKNIFPDNTIGYSDHTLPDENMFTLIASYLFGALIIEKHFTDNKSLKGNDHYHAMDSKDLQTFCQNIEKINLLSGNNKKKVINTENLARVNARRSIVLKTNLKKGTILSGKEITTKRPGTGIEPVYWDNIIGKKLLKDLEKDHILNWEDII